MTARLERRGSRTLVERLSAFKGGVHEAVAKATDSTLTAPKQKHLDALISLTFQRDFAIDEIVWGPFQRQEKKNWVVVGKACVVVHALMRSAHERYAQFTATSHQEFALDSFLDTKHREGLAMSAFIRRYSKYLNARLDIYRRLGYDICNAKGSTRGAAIGKAAPPKLYTMLSTLQELMDSALHCVTGDIGEELSMSDSVHGEFSVQLRMTSELIRSNPVIEAAMRLLLKDMLLLFKVINDGIVNILERFFQMQKRTAQDGLKIYRVFIRESQQLDDFLRTCREADLLEHKDMPKLGDAPQKMLPSMTCYVDNYIERGMSAKRTSPGGRPAAGSPAGPSPASNNMRSPVKKHQQIAIPTQPFEQGAVPYTPLPKPAPEKKPPKPAQQLPGTQGATAGWQQPTERMPAFTSDGPRLPVPMDFNEIDYLDEPTTGQAFGDM